MNMIMDNGQHQQAHHQQTQHQQQHITTAATTPPLSPDPGRNDLHLTTPPTTPTSISNNNNNETTTPTATTTTVVSNKSTLKRSFDVAFLMMPDERIKQKQIQAEKQARLAAVAAATLERHQYPTDLSPRSQQQHQQQLHQQLTEASPLHMELFNFQEARRFGQHITNMRSPRIYDDPSVVIPAAAAAAAVAVAAAAVEQQQLNSATASPPPPPLKSAFTKVTSFTRLESPIPPPLSPDQLSCPSMSPPMASTPPRTNSGNGSLSNGSNGNGAAPPSTQPPPPPCLNPNMVYQSFRPDYQFNGGAFQSVNQVQALQAQRIKQQLLYRPPTNGGNGVGGPIGSPPNSAVHGAPPPEFLTGYAGFPFPAAAVTAPELPRIVQNPAAAAILSTLIPPTLASTFSLTAQNVCAKCNISFRMTSDLVYHMRSHHKSEVACDPNRRKREEKLKCPVCQESFRERHHLTRHMTAHQDKESDQIQLTTSQSAAAAAASAAASCTNGGDLNLANTHGNSLLNGNVRHHHGSGSRLTGMPK